MIYVSAIKIRPLQESVKHTLKGYVFGVPEKNYEFEEQDDIILVKYIYEPPYLGPDDFISELCLSFRGSMLSYYHYGSTVENISTKEISPNVYEFIVEKSGHVIDINYERSFISRSEMFWETFKNSNIMRFERDPKFLVNDNKIVRLTCAFPKCYIFNKNRLDDYIIKLFRREGDKVATNYKSYIHRKDDNNNINITIYIG